MGSKSPGFFCLDIKCYEVGAIRCKKERFLVDTIIKKIEKAYGGCRICYGKGYSTVHRGLRMAADFEGEEDWETTPRPHAQACSCPRGKDWLESRKLPLA